MKKLFILTALSLMSHVASANLSEHRFKCSNDQEYTYAKVLIKNYTTQQNEITYFHQEGALLLYSTEGKLTYKAKLELEANHMGLRCGYQNSLEGYDNYGNKFIQYTDYLTPDCNTHSVGQPIRSITILKLLDYTNCIIEGE